MSHFTVCCRVSAESIAKHGGIDEALTALLAPYQENNMGDCPKEYLAFSDESEEVEEGWGKLDESARAKYASKAAYAKEYYGYDEHEGKFGYFENPNKKWDWWQTGGRWTGFFPLKPNVEPELGDRSFLGSAPEERHGDYVTIDQIDFDVVVSRMHENALKFWNEWQRLILGETFGPFEGPRSRAIDIGLLVVRQGPPEPGEERRAISWAGKVPDSDSRCTWHDVWTETSKEEFLQKYLEAFNPIQTYARLDETGWQQPGRMGWWACSDATAESRAEYTKNFTEWLRATPANAKLVVVDCHI